jgi:hypothetical protein
MAKISKKPTKGTQKQAMSKTAPAPSKKTGAKSPDTQKKKAASEKLTATSKKKTGTSKKKLEGAPKGNGHALKKARSAPGAAKQSRAKARGPKAAAPSGNYKNQIYSYLNKIRPRTSTLEGIYDSVDPPVTDVLRQRALKEDLDYLIHVEKKVVEVSIDVYLAVTF